MNDDAADNQNADKIQELSIKIPLRLAKRIETYAKETDNNITGVVIEALDVFLRDGRSL